MKTLFTGALALLLAASSALAQVGGGVYGPPALPLVGGTLNGDLKFSPDATYDIGKSGATRPRNIFASGTGTFGGTLTGAGLFSTAGIQAATSSAYSWGLRNWFTAPADGKYGFANNAATSGAVLDFVTTDALVTFRNRADNAYADINAGIIQGINGLAAGAATGISWASRTSLESPANGRVLLRNSAATAGSQIDISTDGTIKFRDRTNATDATITAGVAQFTGQLSTTAGSPIISGAYISGPFPRTVTTATDTVTSSDETLIFNTAATCTATLPPAASYPGRWLYVRNIAAFAVNSASANVVPLAGGAAGTALLPATAGKFAWLKSDGTNWQIMAGN